MKKDVISGIYKIENVKNGKVYIGSSKDIYKRWEQHKRDLNNECHHSYKLQNEWNIYKENNFKFSIVETVDSLDGILDLEQKYIDDMNCCINGYNVAKSTKNGLYSDYKKKEPSSIDYILNDIVGMNSYCNKLDYYKSLSKNDIVIKNIYKESKQRRNIYDLILDVIEYNDCLMNNCRNTFRYSSDIIVYTDNISFDLYTLCNKDLDFIIAFLKSLKVNYIKFGEERIYGDFIIDYEFDTEEGIINIITKYEEIEVYLDKLY